MSTVKADTVQPRDFAGDLTLGATGDTVTVAANSINVDKVQDKGSNTLWDFSTGEFVSTKKEFASQNLKLLTTSAAINVERVSFTAQLDSTYDVYIFEFININPHTNGAEFTFQVSSNGGSTYGIAITSTMFVAYHNEAGNSSNLAYESSYDLANSTSYCPVLNAMGSEADECASGELHFFAPSSTTYVKHFYSRLQEYHFSNYAQDQYTAGFVNTTSAINAITFKMDSGNFDGTIKMYGLL